MPDDSVCGGCPLPECDPHCPGSGATVTLQQSEYDRLVTAERDRDSLTTERDEAVAACAQLKTEADVTDEMLSHLQSFPALSPDPSDGDEVLDDPKDAWEAGFERAIEIVSNKIALIDMEFPLRPYRVYLEGKKDDFEIIQGRSPRHAKRESKWYCKVAWLSIKAERVGSLGADMLAYIKGLEGLLREFTHTPQEMQEMMRREGFAIDNLDDRWQKLAFTLYAQIVSMATEADNYLKECGK